MSYDSDVQVLPPSGLINLRLAATAHDDAVGSVLGLALPRVPNTTSADHDRLALWWGPNEWLLRMPDGTEKACASHLRDTLQGTHAAVTCVSDAYIVLEISGPEACELLCQGTGIDVHPGTFPTGRCVRTRFARTRVAIYVAAAARSYHLFVPRSYADHTSRWLERALGRI
jgi:sarcosine oxidase subunit gamma